MAPPAVATVGEVNRTPAFPLARFTVTGPTCSTGAGPDSASRRLMVSLLAHVTGDAVTVPFVCTAHVYAPPSRRAPVGTVQDGAACQPEDTTVPAVPSAPVAIRNW